MNKIVIYTSIFGNYDGLIPQKKIKGIDFICFTDQDFKSNVWKIVKSTGKYSDNNRNAKEYKILPHKFLSEYDISIWIDGNFYVKENPIELINEMKQHPMLAFSHSRTCIYEEHEAILTMGKTIGKFKDDPQLMQTQIERYRNEGYPVKNGLTQNGILMRRHNDAQVINAMEYWWKEISAGSKRDQLSLFYVLWKTGLPIKVLSQDSRNNKWFYMIGRHRKNYRWKLFRYKIKRFFGIERKYK